jgi:hypothetical protein
MASKPAMTPSRARISRAAHAHVIPSGTYRFPRKNEMSAS